MASVVCPKCATRLKLTSAPTGQAIKCPKCQASFRTAPAASAPSPRHDDAAFQSPAYSPPRRRRGLGFLLWGCATFVFFFIGLGAGGAAAFFVVTTYVLEQVTDKGNNIVAKNGGDNGKADPLTPDPYLDKKKSDAKKTEKKEPVTPAPKKDPTPKVEPKKDPTPKVEPKKDPPKVEPKDTWVVHASTNGGVKAKFPRKPKDFIDKADPPPVVVIECEHFENQKYIGRFNVMIERLDPDAAKKTPKDYLKDVAKVFKGDDTKIKDTAWKEHPAIEIIGTGMPNGVPVTETMVVFVIKGKSYQLSVHQRKGHENPDEMKRFFDSIEITGEPMLPEVVARPKPKAPAITLAKLSGVTHLALSPKGTLFATASDTSPGKSRVAVWNAKSGELVKVLDQDTADFQVMAISPDDSTLACLVKQGNMIKLWDIMGNKMLREVPLPKKNGEINEAKTCFAFRSDGKGLALAHNGVPLQIDVATGETTMLAPGLPEDPNTRLAYSPATDAIAAARVLKDGAKMATKIALLTLADNQAVILDDRPEQIGLLAFAPNGKKVAASLQSEKGIVLFFDIPGPTGKGSVDKATKSGLAYRPIVFSPDGKYMGAVSRNEGGFADKMEIWDLSAKKSIKTVDVALTDDALVLPDGQTLVVCSTDAPCLRYYDITTGEKKKSPWSK